MLAAMAPVVALIKIGIGLGRDKPVEYRMTLCVISILAMLAIFGRRPLRSRAGDVALNKMRAQHFGLRKLPRYIGLSPAELAMALGLFGMPALADTSLADLRKTLQPPPSEIIVVVGDVGAVAAAGVAVVVEDVAEMTFLVCLPSLKFYSIRRRSGDWPPYH